MYMEEIELTCNLYVSDTFYSNILHKMSASKKGMHSQ